jgi:hypothetical protein
MQATRKNNATYNKKNEYSPHAYSQMMKNSDQLCQNHYYSHFYMKAKQTQANYAIRAAKRQRMSKATL